MDFNHSLGECSDPQLRPSAQPVFRDDFSLFDPSFFGLSQGDLSLDILDNETDSAFTLQISSSSINAKKNHVSKSRGRKRSKALKFFTVDDFETEEERDAFLMILGYADCILNRDQTLFSPALAFFFGQSENDVSLDLCCAVLGARPDIIRIRFQYEFWLRQYRFLGPFDFVSTPLPKTIAAEIQYYSGPVGIAIAREVWVQPGMHTEELFRVLHETDQIETQTILSSLDILLNRHVVSQESNMLYVTGRNPLLQNMRDNTAFGPKFIARGGTVSWSRMF